MDKPRIRVCHVIKKKTARRPPQYMWKAAWGMHSGTGITPKRAWDNLIENFAHVYGLHAASGAINAWRRM